MTKVYILFSEEWGDTGEDIVGIYSKPTGLDGVVRGDTEYYEEEWELDNIKALQDIKE